MNYDMIKTRQNDNAQTKKEGDTMVELDPIRADLASFDKPLVEMGDSL